jgi:hypothetical protein
MNAYHQFKDLEEICAKLGFRMSRDPLGLYANKDFGDLICLLPGNDEELPAYSRDAVIFRGDLNECLTFLHGWQQSRYYLEIIGAIKKGVVEKAEQKHLEDLESQRTIYAIRNGKDPGDLRKKANKAKLEEEDAIPF